jgi:spore maturation protein CgeB
VRELIASPDFRERIAAAGVEKVRKKFSAAIMADKVMEVYRIKNSSPGSLGN